MSEQPVTTCETCGAPVTIQGDTTLHYQPVPALSLTIEGLLLWCELKQSDARWDAEQFKAREQEFSDDPDAIGRLRDARIAALAREATYEQIAQIIRAGRMPE